MTDDPYPPILAHQHRHVCGCGDYLVCSTELDRCCVTEPLMCSRGDMAERDAYFERMIRPLAVIASMPRPSANGVLIDIDSAEALGALLTTPHPGWAFWRNQPVTTPAPSDWYKSVDWQRAFRGTKE